ncbi:MAG TPA: TlpA disulfide reductase family protein [Ilumatobacteraceae bacterium]|nr:TlpA disulfide reductase family protein [Ilumatobacteraceae bacterium]HRB04172.1 TlpA disulfide reductase family protein [Ilumatobacteraceae bacterium]
MKRSPSVVRLTAVAIAFLLVVACTESQNASVADVKFTGADGSATTVSDFVGKPLVLNMWATYCGPCLKEMPALDQIATEFAIEVNIIGVNVFDAPEKAASFARDLGVSYSQFSDPDGALSTALEVSGLPATAFFDAKGTLLDVHQGAYTADELRDALAAHHLTGPEGTEST